MVFVTINRIPDFFLLVDKYRKLYNNKTGYYSIIEAKNLAQSEEIYHIQVKDGNLFHYLENLSPHSGGERFIIHKVQIPENNDVVISINENHNWVNLKAPPEMRWKSNEYLIHMACMEYLTQQHAYI